MFQFHTGSIKSQPLFCLRNRVRLGFNSTLVRLKACACAAVVLDAERFNSTLVRLKENSQQE